MKNLLIVFFLLGFCTNVFAALNKDTSSPIIPEYYISLGVAGQAAPWNNFNVDIGKRVKTKKHFSLFISASHFQMSSYAGNGEYLGFEESRQSSGPYTIKTSKNLRITQFTETSLYLSASKSFGKRNTFTSFGGIGIGFNSNRLNVTTWRDTLNIGSVARANVTNYTNGNSILRRFQPRLNLSLYAHATSRIFFYLSHNIGVTHLIKKNNGIITTDIPVYINNAALGIGYKFNCLKKST